jgi:2,3-bisphosphoglycerate-independent phosphoglycerate mutase
MPQTPLVLAILDGWGVAPDSEGNAISRAYTPNMDGFLREYPAMTLSASGNEVGLNFGEMGNSEVGHLNIGAGRIYYQTFPRINKAIADKSFFQNRAFLEAIEHTKQRKSALHIIGLVSPGNVHASQEHLHEVLALAKEHKIKQVYIHAILDGRDTQYNSGKVFITELIKKTKEYKVGEIATISGRFFAMDRDNRWDRIEAAYRAMVDGVSVEYFTNPLDAIDASYTTNVFDEEFVPVVIGKEGRPTRRIQAGDSVIFCNFRADRARQLTQAFVLPAFTKFERPYLEDVTFVTMTEYEKEIPVRVAFPPIVIHNSLAEMISKAGLRQYHVAETEKYAHITFFLNGTIEDPFEGETRNIIPSPQVKTYDLAPEMSADSITKDVVQAITSSKYDVIFLNYANADMVGHTGDYDATIKGVEAVDRGLGIIAQHVLAKDGILMITADHGNAEEIKNLQTGERDKEHSTNPVPCIIIGKQFRGQAGLAGDPPDGDLSLLRPVGMLADVAPTILRLLQIPLPEEMTGRPLL